MSGKSTITIRGARLHNLKNISLELPLNRCIVVTGVSGSGKSSLAFDTLYAEGQRRYIETFSSYARQFLDRMDRPLVDEILGIPPAIAIDQTNPIKTSRSTVGTMTGINDYMKVLFARAGQLHCRQCGRAVLRDTPQTIFEDLLRRAQGKPALVTFRVTLPAARPIEEAFELLRSQGFLRVLVNGELLRLDEAVLKIKPGNELRIVQDRIQIASSGRARIVESLESALRLGKGNVEVVISNGATLPYSSSLHCAHCDISYQDPQPNLFSFNSPLGACEACRGFGRVIEIDPGRVIPDPNKSLQDGAIKPWTSPAYQEGYYDLMRFCRQHGIAVNVPWVKLSAAHRRMIYEGTDEFYGVRGFFDWMESRVYKMHVRVYLSRYRAYVPCKSCNGSRLKPDALLFRLDGQTVADIYDMPITTACGFFDELKLGKMLQQATSLLLREIRSRLNYLRDVGVGYLTLHRQSRTLSGGEVERVSLTTALGSSLVNTLYVLDEPSIGLHPRDISRLTELLMRLRDAGNTVLVVEHDPEMICSADTVIDMGPGPGECGGEVVHFGTVVGLAKKHSSLSGCYISGRCAISLPVLRRPINEKEFLRVRGAREHNLKQIDVEIPLGMMVCVTGVSGSGKSTLVADVLYNGLAQQLGHKAGTPGTCRAIEGGHLLGDVVLVDQSPLGTTPRANPASYIGAFDRIRRVFASTEEARGRSYTASTFSFNTPGGRCELCKGSGFEKIEMQFLSDVYLSCPACNGSRYGKEALEIRWKDKTIADVLEMTVAEARNFFGQDSEISKRLLALERVGLDYLRLGQPLNTLSGGEAQRLKLSAQMAQAAPKTLFIFDEPTTGLHLDDINTLLRAMDKLIEADHSLLIIEHNLDVIKCADYIIDLGPEGGEEGGRVVATGTPEEISRCSDSYTGRYLRSRLSGRLFELGTTRKRATHLPKTLNNFIAVIGAREHNLRGIDVEIPRNKFVVVTGVSGSGKSTLVFDVLFAEGQRRYLDVVSAYARQYIKELPRPEVDHIDGIPPTVAIEQLHSRGSRRSTVATVTEIYHYLRLLFAKLGTQYCLECDLPVRDQTLDDLLARLQREVTGHDALLLAPVIRARKGFHTEIAKWAAKHGYDKLRVDGEIVKTAGFLPPERYREHNIEVVVAELADKKQKSSEMRELLSKALSIGKGTALVSVGGQDTIYSLRRTCSRCGRSFAEPDPRMFSFNSLLGACPSCNGLGVIGVSDEESKSWDTAELVEKVCPECNGARLNPTALSVKLDGKNIAEITALSVEQIGPTLESIRFAARERTIAEPIMAELRARVSFLREVGLSYLNLNRSADTLAGGEAQRVRLAAQLGSNLRGVCYILDEPTIGLHPRDNLRLIATLKKLKNRGNTVVVVEHDETTIRSSDLVIDLGPGAGVRGGTVVARGTPSFLARSKDSATAKCLKNPMGHPMMGQRRSLKDAQWVTIQDAAENNLKKITVRVPLGRFVCITGVSGSGKSTLMTDVLYKGLRARQGDGNSRPGKHRDIVGAEQVQRVVIVDQSPIGRTPRSIPATYVGFFDEIRKLYAKLPESQARGYRPNRFSFNVKGGRCEKCLGQGVIKMGMSFLPDVHVPCEVCDGKRYNADTLAVAYKGKSIAEVLEMTVDEAAEFFSAVPRVRAPLEILDHIGLGYLHLGQTSPTLSGGEAQRIKLASELANPTWKKTMYLLEEPTTGLHTADIEPLLRVLHRLVDEGHSLVVIEHNLDFIAEADYIIDLGPEGGEEGGYLVAAGAPEEIIAHPNGSYTAKFLASYLSRKGMKDEG